MRIMIMMMMMMMMMMMIIIIIIIIIIINYNFTSSPYSPGIFTIDPLEVAIQSDSISPMHVLKCHWMEKLRYLTVPRNGLVITDSTYLLRTGRSGVRTLVEARFSVPVHIGPEAHPASCTMGSESLFRAKSSEGVAMTTQPHIHVLPYMIVMA
jgi:hypothetical protein